MINKKIIEKRRKIAGGKALKEANDRKKKIDNKRLAIELGGRDGPEPTRYGDWEKKGIAVDF